MSRRSLSAYQASKQAAWTRAQILGGKSAAVLPDVPAHECRAETREGYDAEWGKVKITWRH